MSEATTGGVWSEKVLLKISEISSKNTCVGVSFNKVADLCVNIMFWLLLSIFTIPTKHLFFLCFHIID